MTEQRRRADEEQSYEQLYSSSANDVQVGGNHYKDMPIQPWTLMESVMSREEFRGFLKGNIIKYSLRAGRKEGSSDDADKARHYMKKLLETEYK